MDATCFSSEVLILDIPGQYPQQISKLTTACAEDADPLVFDNKHVAAFSSRAPDNYLILPGFENISKAMQGKLKELMEDNKNNIPLVESEAGVRVLENTMMLFSPENLTSIVVGHGLEVTAAGHIGPDGHALSDATARASGSNFVSLMTRMPLEDSA